MHIHWMHILLGAWLAVSVALMLIFHYSTRNTCPAPSPEAKPAKLIPKNEVWSQPAYDYHRTSSPDGAVTPIEPGDSDPPPDS